jgi:phage tail-like protein
MNPYFSFNKLADWQKGTSSNLHISDKGLSVSQTEKYGIQRIILLEDVFRILNRTVENAADRLPTILDFAVGRNGKLFLLDEQTNLWMYDFQNENRELLFTAGHELFSNKAKLAAVENTLYFADPLGERKLSAYSATNGQAFWSLDEWNGLTLYPLAFTVNDTFHAFALIPLDLQQTAGEVETAENGRLGIIQINDAGDIIRMYESVDLRISKKLPLTSMLKRYNLTLLPNLSISVLDTLENQLFIFTETEEFNYSVSSDPLLQYSGFAADSYGSLYVGNRRSLDVSQEEDERFVIKWTEKGIKTAQIACFRGRVDKLLVDRNNKMYLLNLEEALLTILQPNYRTMEHQETQLLQALYYSPEMDSQSTETVWHKIQLEASIPEETQIRISYFASDLKNHPFPMWSNPIVNPRDALFFEAKGQYLRLKVEFHASEQKTPQLHRLRAYFPRTSFLSYLPAVYQEDPTSQYFLERYLSLFGTFYEEMEEEISEVSQYYDVDTISGEFVKWLGTWVGIHADEVWSESQLKELIRRSPELYQERGTKQGIEKMVQIYTGEKPFIVEYFQYKMMLEKPELKALVTQLYGANPYTFCVLVQQHCMETEKQRLFVQKILDEQKPAFTEAKLVVLQPWMYMDTHSYIGINTFLSEPNWLSLDHNSTLPYDTLLTDEENKHRIGYHTRIELDSELE